MAMKVRWLVLGAALLLSAAAWAQDKKVVTKTLVVSEAQKECISLNNRQRLFYKFHADGPVSFKLSHQDEREVVGLRPDAAGRASGSFAPHATAHPGMA